MNPLRWTATWLMLLVAGSVSLFFVTALCATPIEYIHQLMVHAIGRDRLASYTLLDRVMASRKAAAPPNTYKIVIVGGSTTRNSIWSAALAEQIIGEELGMPTRVLDLPSSDQKNATSWALAERSACEGADIVLIGINLARSSKPFAKPGLEAAFDPWPPSLSQFLRMRPERSGPSMAVLPVSDQLRFRAYMVRLVTETVVADYYQTGTLGSHGTSVLDLQRWHNLHYRTGNQIIPALLQEAIVAHTSQPDTVYKSNWSVWTKTVEAVRGCGALPILLQSPVRPSLTESGIYAEHHRAHIRKTNELSRNLDVPIIDPNTLLHYNSGEFYDWGHLGSEYSIRRTTKAIGSDLAGIIKRHQIKPRR